MATPSKLVAYQISSPLSFLGNRSLFGASELVLSIVTILQAGCLSPTVGRSPHRNRRLALPHRRHLRIAVVGRLKLGTPVCSLPVANHRHWAVNPLIITLPIWLVTVLRLWCRPPD